MLPRKLVGSRNFCQLPYLDPASSRGGTTAPPPDPIRASNGPPGRLQLPGRLLRKELSFDRTKYQKFFFVCRALSVRREELCTVPDKNRRSLSFFALPFCGRTTQLYAGEGSVLLSPSDFSRAPPSSYPFYDKELIRKRSSFEAAIAKNAFPKQKRKLPRWPSSSYFVRELTVRKWTLPSMKSIASS